MTRKYKGKIEVRWKY